MVEVATTCDNSILFQQDESDFADHATHLYVEPDRLSIDELFSERFYVASFHSAPPPCRSGCSHYLAGCKIQLNPCAFYNECYRRPSGVDQNADYIYHGVVNGFAIVDDIIPGPYMNHNYSSILDDEFRAQMDATLLDELKRDKVSFASRFPHCVHALGAVRKSSGKLRPITDCRRPLGASINNYMHTTCSTFSYTHIDDVTDALSQGSYMAVVDIKSAYRSIHIAPAHREYQGFAWEFNGVQTYFTDNCLCFGLKCAPWIFTQFTELLVRSMKSRGFERTYGYLDDFLVMADTEIECKKALDVLCKLLTYLGFEIAEEKLVAPSQVVKYLGLHIDSVNMELSLPPDKLERLNKLVGNFALDTKVSATKHDLDSLCGVVSHASKVIRGGRTFSRRMINLANSCSGKWDIIGLPDWFKADIMWWKQFCSIFNGKAPVIDNKVFMNEPVATDSSMSGFGAVWQSDYVVGSWSPNPVIYADLIVPESHWAEGPLHSKENPDINLLELWPVLVAVWRWGREWIGSKVRFKSDNTQVVTMINTGRSRSVYCMAWLRELFWLCFIYDLHITAEYIRTSDNIIPDFLSRVTDPRVRSLHPPIFFFHRCGGFEAQIPVLSEQVDG